ncbi:MAG: S41 family peptidase, partial [Bacteroidota bacterium]
LLVKDREDPGHFKWIWSKTLRTHKPQSPVFEGQLVVLTDGGTYSTATDVVSALHNNREAIFVGQETGGGYYGNTSALHVTALLPNSGLKIDIPMIRYTNPVDKPEWIGRGIIPDVPVVNTYQDVVAGRDAMLETALEQFKK